jgi:bacteriocin resistance YdeI/OmpD-like protein/uncharacterized protein DUF1905
MKFRVTLESSGTAVGMEVPTEVVEGLGQGKRPPVKVTINGSTFRTTVGAMGGRSMIAINATNRAATKVSGGETVEVTLELDTESRELPVPADLAKALKANASAKKRFDGPTASKKKAIIVSIEGAKTEDTRQRRLDKALSDLEAGAA